MDPVKEVSNTAPAEYHLEVAMKRIQELENKDREFARAVRLQIVQQLHNPQWDENLVISRADTLVDYILNGRKTRFNEATEEGHAAEILETALYEIMNLIILEGTPTMVELKAKAIATDALQKVLPPAQEVFTDLQFQKT